MKDDYLWDQTGEPDPEIERLEQMLSVYKHQPRPLHLPARPTVWFSPRLAAAAALILMALAGLWVFVNRDDRTPQTVAVENNTVEQTNTAPVAGAQNAPETISQDDGFKPDPTGQQIAKSPVRRPAGTRPVKRSERTEPDNPYETVEGIAFFDLETAKHLEKAQLLLRSFKNVSLEGDAYLVEASYEKELSRSILQKNVLLRRNAEARGNLPAEELLGSLEPLLLDIANLPEKPTQAEIRFVKERIQKTEMITTLQIYSAPILARSE